MNSNSWKQIWNSWLDPDQQDGHSVDALIESANDDTELRDFVLGDYLTDSLLREFACCDRPRPEFMQSVLDEVRFAELDDENTSDDDQCPHFEYPVNHTGLDFEDVDEVVNHVVSLPDTANPSNASTKPTDIVNDPSDIETSPAVVTLPDGRRAIEIETDSIAGLPHRLKNRRRKSALGRLAGVVVTLASTAAVLIMIAVGAWFSGYEIRSPFALQPDRPRNRLADQIPLDADAVDLSARQGADAGDQPPGKKLPIPDSTRPSEPAFANLVADPAAKWAATGQPGNRIGPGKLHLLEGNATIHFDGGHDIRLSAPVQLELLSNSRVRLDSGKISGLTAFDEKPTNGTHGFVVETPASQLETTSEAEFVANTVPEGPTEIRLVEGTAETRPWFLGRNVPAINLQQNGIDRIVVDAVPPEDEKEMPSRAMATSRDGRFRGWIDVDGRSLQLNTRDAFDTLFDQATRQYRESPQRLTKNWDQLADQFSDDRKLGGSLTMNGNATQLNSIDDVMSMAEKFLSGPDNDQQHINPPVDNQAGSFQGTININGEVHRFNSREEFERAQRKLFPMLDQFFRDRF